MPSAVRKPLVFMVGTAVIIAGIVMLVFPGPGWAGIFLGFAILATEFAFAVTVRDWLVQFIKGLMGVIKHTLKSMQQKISKKS